MTQPSPGMPAFVCDENTGTSVITQLQACQSLGHDDMSSLLPRGKKLSPPIDKVVTEYIDQVVNDNNECHRSEAN